MISYNKGNLRKRDKMMGILYVIIELSSRPLIEEDFLTMQALK